MALNCKQGDLAVLVRSGAGNEGAIFQCLRLATADEVDGMAPATWWVIDKTLTTAWRRRVNLARDDWMRPIRPQSDDAVDTHSLRLPVPHKEHA